jgi:hypothetical protein
MSYTPPPAETLASMQSKIRELTFDRYVTPTFFIRTNPSSNGRECNPYTLTITTTYLQLQQGTNDPVQFSFATYATLDELLTALQGAGLNIDVIYSGSFIPLEPSTTLQVKSATILDKYFPVYRTVYFSNWMIQKYVNEYCMRFLRKTQRELEWITYNDKWDDELKCGTWAQIDHMNYWVAYKMIEKRRLFELAGSNIQMSILGGNPLINGANGTTMVTQDSFSLVPPGETTRIQIADVFSLEDDNTSFANSQYSKEIPKAMLAPWEIGSDNVLSDYYSFWYALQLWIRDRFEDMFSDDCLRKDQMMVGKIHLEKPENLFAYFDQYPWTYSPYPRGIRGSHLI